MIIIEILIWGIISLSLFIIIHWFAFSKNLGRSAISGALSIDDSYFTGKQNQEKKE